MVLTLLFCTNACSEKYPNSPNAGIPAFSSEFGLYEFYDSLKEKNGGQFRNWTPEKKAEFYELIPLLSSMENERVHQINKDYHADTTLLASIYVQKYIYPNEKMISLSDATSMASHWASSRHLIEEEDIPFYTITAGCIQQSIEPEWSIGFYNKSRHLAEVRMNAFSGEFPEIDVIQATNMIIEFSVDEGIPTDIQLSDLFAGAGYDYDKKIWTFVFIDSLDDAGITYYIDEETMKVIPGPNG